MSEKQNDCCYISDKMGNLFASKKKPVSRITEQDRAILELKKQRDQLQGYQKKIENEQEKLKQLAKQCLKNGEKDKAKLILKKKRRQETLLKQTDEQIDNLEVMANDIEFAQLESNVVQGLKVGNESLKAMHKIMSYEDVEKIMDETREGIEYQQELDELLSGSLTPEDESEVLAELDELLGVEAKQVDLQLPDVPSEAPPVEKHAEKPKKQPTPVAAS
ncbi:charged multivesicular body protein 6-A-like [Clavelina lepadiformis]|uniref:Charged multivesicular body protein 6 n=1 Tax=Clavelina lepadiformis TaxID=159417 RepID=A0ABP0FAW1_CLALP